VSDRIFGVFLLFFSVWLEKNVGKGNLLVTFGSAPIWMLSFLNTFTHKNEIGNFNHAYDKSDGS